MAAKAAAAAAAAIAAAGGCGNDDGASAELTSKMKRLRFGISKMVSDPRIYYPKVYKRSATTFRFGSETGGSPTSKYLARKCSIVEKSEEEDEF